MPSSSVVRAVAVALVVGFAPPLAAQGVQPVPGTSVSLVPLEGFVPADGFAGFMNEETGASVMVVEMPAEAHAEVAPIFSDLATASAALGQQGVAVESLGTLTTEAGRGDKAATSTVASPPRGRAMPFVAPWLPS